MNVPTHVAKEAAVLLDLLISKVMAADVLFDPQDMNNLEDEEVQRILSAEETLDSLAVFLRQLAKG